jgi:hypothetical protein
MQRGLRELELELAAVGRHGATMGAVIRCDDVEGRSRPNKE